MSKLYQQLTEKERIEIYSTRQERKTIAQIAEALGRGRAKSLRARQQAEKARRRAGPRREPFPPITPTSSFAADRSRSGFC